MKNLRKSLNFLIFWKVMNITKQFLIIILIQFKNIYSFLTSLHSLEFIKLFIRQQNEGNCFPLNFWWKQYPEIIYLIQQRLLKIWLRARDWNSDWIVWKFVYRFTRGTIIFNNYLQHNSHFSHWILSCDWSVASSADWILVSDWLMTV